MAKILLDYVFPITVITPTPAASTAFLKQVCLVVKPKSGQEGNVGQFYECTSMTSVSARTDNTNAQQFFNAGMSKVYILLADDLDLTVPLSSGDAQDFYTVFISDDFDKDDVIMAQAQGAATITSYANLVSGTPDSITVGATVFTAQSGSVTPGAATFQAATSNNSTATSLAAQINAHAVAGALVVAEANSAIVTIKAKLSGNAGNDIAVVYTDNDTNVGITLSGLTAGKLSGGAGMELGTFSGVVGVSENDIDFLEDQAAIANRVAFYISDTNGAKNSAYAFGKILSNPSNWLNQQYITMPFDDGIDERGEAESLFEKRISFVLKDDEFGIVLAFFVASGKAITAPYITKNIRVDIQSRGLQWITANQPDYTLKNAALLETRLQEDVLNAKYIDTQLITAGEVEITLVQDNFVANGDINISEPKALWRVFSEMRQTL